MLQLSLLDVASTFWSPRIAAASRGIEILEKLGLFPGLGMTAGWIDRIIYDCFSKGPSNGTNFVSRNGKRERNAEPELFCLRAYRHESKPSQQWKLLRVHTQPTLHRPLEAVKKSRGQNV